MEDDEPDYDPLKESLTFFEGLFNPFERLFSPFGVEDEYFLFLLVRLACRERKLREKWPIEILGVRRERKEGLPSRPKSWNYALPSHCKPKKRSLDNALSTLEIRFTSCKISENRKAKQSVGITSLRP